MKKLAFIALIGAIVLAIIFAGSKPSVRHYGSLFKPDPVVVKKAKILFVGDMMFDRYIRQMANEKGEDFIFSCIGDFLRDADVVVGNLEGPITGNASISLGSKIESAENYVFTFPPSTAKLLAKNNIKIVNLGNNHIGNFGPAGISSTKKYLTEAGIGYFLEDEIYRTKIGGINMSFILYNEFGGDSTEKVSQKIKGEKQNSQTVFVYVHWGNEYSEIPDRIKNVAKLFANSGADLIIGSHPHIILSSEKIGNTFVYYSLGNFIFDQYWNKEVSTGLVLELNIKNGDIYVTEHRVSLLPNGQTCPMK